MVCGIWCGESGGWKMMYGKCGMESAVWKIGYGVWCMIHDVRNTVYGISSMDYAVWNYGV